MAQPLFTAIQLPLASTLHSQTTLIQVTALSSTRACMRLHAVFNGDQPPNFLRAMHTKRDQFDRIKQLTHAGKHIEAQALYEQLIQRRSDSSEQMIRISPMF